MEYTVKIKDPKGTEHICKIEEIDLDCAVDAAKLEKGKELGYEPEEFKLTFAAANHGQNSWCP